MRRSTAVGVAAGIAVVVAFAALLLLDAKTGRVGLLPRWDLEERFGGVRKLDPAASRAAGPDTAEGPSTRRTFSARLEAYPWITHLDQADLLANRIAPPAGYHRPTEKPGSFGHWLRRLPLKKGRPPVYLHNGRLKANQTAHSAVVDIDVGPRDLQQCADAVIRLRAEFLWSAGLARTVQFRFTSGHRADWPRWAAGARPVVRGSDVRWVQLAGGDASYPNFRRYLNTVFAYAGTRSLAAELKPVRSPKHLRIGDVFLRAGSPGHCVIVVDLAEHRPAGKKVFLTAQSYMPAQQIHILRNPRDGKLSPWYDLAFGYTLVTPEYTFRPEDLRRFPATAQ